VGPLQQEGTGCLTQAAKMRGKGRQAVLRGTIEAGRSGGGLPLRRCSGQCPLGMPTGHTQKLGVHCTVEQCTYILYRVLQYYCNSRPPIGCTLQRYTSPVIPQCEASS